MADRLSDRMADALEEKWGDELETEGTIAAWIVEVRELEKRLEEAAYKRTVSFPATQE